MKKFEKVEYEVDDLGKYFKCGDLVATHYTPFGTTMPLSLMGKGNASFYRPLRYSNKRVKTSNQLEIWSSSHTEAKIEMPKEPEPVVDLSLFSISMEEAEKTNDRLLSLSNKYTIPMVLYSYKSLDNLQSFSNMNKHTSKKEFGIATIVSDVENRIVYDFESYRKFFVKVFFEEQLVWCLLDDLILFR